MATKRDYHQEKAAWLFADTLDALKMTDLMVMRAKWIIDEEAMDHSSYQRVAK